MKEALMITALSAVLLLSGCGGRPDNTGYVFPTPAVTLSPQETPPQQTKAGQIPSYADGRELIASVKSQEEAQELAELYGIELVKFQSGVASFHTEENPVNVIARGEANDWPRLELNHLGKADG